MSLTAQTDVAPQEETIQLPEFTVSTTADKGYRASNSVSATRIDTAIKDLPFTVSAFTEQFISDLGNRDLPEIASFAPGVTSGAKEFTQGNTRFSIRGFDGAVAPQRNGFTGNLYVDTANVSRVEVLQGPASLLYGQITPGGTINYITKRPTDKPFTNIRVEGGTHSFYRGILDYNQPIGARIGSRLIVAYENGSQWADVGESNSKLFAPSLTIKVSPKASLILDYEWAHRNETPPITMLPNIQIAGLTGAGTSTNFPNVSARSREQALNDVGALNMGFLNAPVFNRKLSIANNGDYRKSDFDTFNSELNVKIGDHWSTRANFNYNKLKIAQKVTGLAQWDVTPTAAYRSASLTLFDYLNSYLADPEGTLADTSKTTSVVLQRRKRLQQSFAKSNAVQVEAAGKYEFAGITFSPLVGAFQIYTRGGGFTRTAATADYFTTWNYFNPAGWDRTGVFDENSLPLDSGYNVTKSTDTAYYGVLSASLFKNRLILIAGARSNKTKTDTYNMNAGGVLSGNFEASKTTPQVGIGFHATKDTLLYANYSESYLIEARTLNRPNPNYDPNQNLNTVTNPNSITVSAVPTIGKGYEAGVKTDFLSGRVSSTLVFFHLERKNRVLSVRQAIAGLSTTGTPSSQDVTFTSQGTVDQSEGVQFEITWSPTDHWQVYATTALMDIKTTKFEAPTKRASTDTSVSGDYNAYLAGYDEAVGLIKGAVPEGSAERLASLWTRYNFTSGLLANFWVAGGGTYTSPKASRTANPTLFFDSYILLNASAGYDLKAGGKEWNISLNMKNVADKQYTPANQARGTPRETVLSVSTKF